ncbi:MAG: efflux RND transporter periplasmic adaptor subunit [Saprospiraceae bacterium]|nr:efflux RND transporter periplasmic adaptor subunit [Saprospiraceae bacterium]
MKYIVIIIAILGLCFAACKNEEKKSFSKEISEVEGIYVKTVRVEKYTEESDISVMGIIMSESEAKPSFKTGGIIQRTYVKEGDMVRKGQLLAILKMDEINAQVRQAEEGLAKAERDMKRVQNLYTDSVATLEQYQNATTGYEVAGRTTEIARFNQNYSKVYAPISGKIVKQMMRTGEITGPGTPVFAIMGIGNKDWVIKTGLIDRDWARIGLNDKVKVEMDAYPGKIYDAYISNKSSVGSNASGTFDVDIKFRNQPVNLAAGLTANTFISTNSKESFSVIPIEALVKSDGNTAYAYTIVEGKAKKIVLKIAKLLGDKVAVSQGLDGIEEVVTIGSMYLEEGDKINFQK